MAQTSNKLTTWQDSAGVVGCFVGAALSAAILLAVVSFIGPFVFGNKVVGPPAFYVAIGTGIGLLASVVYGGVAGYKLGVAVASPPSPLMVSAYHESDNHGTRHDTLDLASSYWFARLHSHKKDPFVIYTFDDEQHARAALLELPYIHVANDTNSLICTETLIFGCYAVDDGKYEAVICGEDLALNQWENVHSSFVRHGGRLKNEERPHWRPTASDTNLSADEAPVIFVNELKSRNQAGHVCTYAIHKGPSAAAAKHFLAQRIVSKQLYYIVVETPEGNYGRDIDGIYKE
jgi:hypothetical protein